MKDRFEQLRRDFESDLKRAENVRDIEQLQVKYLGRKGPIQTLMQDLRSVSSEERPFFGKLVNELKQELEKLCEQGQHAFRQTELAKRIQDERIDVTLPGRKKFLGRLHPVSKMMDDVLDTLRSMGFSVQLGPDIDSDYYNFEGLNFAPDHPARDMQDTFYVSQDHLLRTHTSNTQLRVMEKHSPPIRVVMPGTTYRNETVTARSHVFFHQVEGMYIDKGVTFGDLLSTMEEFWTKVFQMELKMRFRPSYFPFVEPGMEVDISCISCKGEGCRLCKNTGWLEVCGAGMIHPVVLRNGGIDPEVYSGYAWGLGVERPAILRWGVTDIRDFFENDHRFLSQF
jgi:phenylalanyl-tRNA synthetase alpha chain